LTAGRRACEGGERDGRRPPAVPLAAVFLNGDYEEPGYYTCWARAADLVVAADGGGRFLAAAGIVPDLLVGDFDSLDEAAAAAAGRSGARVVRHPVRKDRTDGELAVDEALREGAGELVLAGALGALDHVLGHLALLGRIEARGTPARVVSPDLTARVLLAATTVRLDAVPGTRVSLAPLAGEAIVTLAGFDYDLDHGRLPGDACLGLGNAVAGPAEDERAARAGTVVSGPAGATISVHEGRLVALVFDGQESFGGLRRLDRSPAPA
jgi:thiamine pyrophosphokinase